MDLGAECMEVSQWFWMVLEQARLDLGCLAVWLESASRLEIEEFAREFRCAKARVIADYSKGIEIDGVAFSDEVTEDFCDWIVAQGRPVWQAALARRDYVFALAREYRRTRESGSKAAARQAWNPAVLGQKYAGSHTPRRLADAVYDARFGADPDDA
jgi:hypothetical protein